MIKYIAYLTQVDQNDPTARVVLNTYPTTVTVNRGDTGETNFITDGQFDENTTLRVFPFMGAIPCCQTRTADQLRLTIIGHDGNEIDGVLDNIRVEIHQD